MIALVLAMLRSRWARALTVALLTALATAAAVAAPVYVDRADRRIVAAEVAGAAAGDLNVVVTGQVESTGDGSMPRTFESLASGWLDAPGYESVFSAQFVAQPTELPVATAEQLSRISYRERLCEHVVIVAGRCLMGAGEAVVGEHSAERLGVKPGQAISMSGSRYDDLINKYVPAGGPTALTVVGIVRARDSAEPYWGRSGALADLTGPALSVDRRTLATFARPAELQAYNAYPRPGAISVASLDALRDWVVSAKRRSTEGARLSTDLDGVIERIDERRAAVRATVPYAVAPVLVLAWAVIVLAVSAAARARRFEHGIIALRGVARHWRWWLAAGEMIVAVPVGAVAGFSVAGGWSTPGALRYAGIAVLGAVLLALVVAVRTVAAPVSALLREVERRVPRWRGAVVLVLVAAAVATVQLRGADGFGGGVALVAPALVMLAVALAAAAVVPPLAAAAARRSLRRGRLAAALAGLRLARRPVGARVLVVLVVALASLGFAAAAGTAVTQRQAVDADVSTGAPVVLQVGASSRTHLLSAVRAADPDGRYAMAVVPIPASAAAPAVLAVDATRLDRVAILSHTSASVPRTELAGLLHPPVDGEPVVLTTDHIALDVTVTSLDRTDIAFAVTVAPRDGRATTAVELGALRPGRATYAADLPCAAGCRLVDLTVRLPPYLGPTVVLAVHNPPSPRWRVAPGASAAPADGGGVTFTLPASSRADAGILRTVDAPEALPVLATGPLPPEGTVGSFGGKSVQARIVATADRLPRLGTTGALVDLDYADRLATDSAAEDAEVWLTADAPPSIVDALVSRGLTVESRHTVGDARTALAGEGSAQGLRFYLVAGAIAVALAAAALIVGTIGGSAADLRALRAQGLPARTARLVEPLAALRLVLAAGVAGAVAAVAAWLAAAGSLPGLRWAGVPPLAEPAVAFGSALVLLAVVAVLSSQARLRVTYGTSSPSGR
ncbi:hypothetical protein ABZS66_36265 [Dactylosporangium sp. NPDC005572]|uniref:hypothetical protein n=1 Tax=Dactylosporangium sp. NPDC005572 TaxID=3156889 RepID=UPI0033B57041